MAAEYGRRVLPPVPSSSHIFTQAMNRTHTFIWPQGAFTYQDVHCVYTFYCAQNTAQENFLCCLHCGTKQYRPEHRHNSNTHTNPNTFVSSFATHPYFVMCLLDVCVFVCSEHYFKFCSITTTTYSRYQSAKGSVPYKTIFFVLSFASILLLHNLLIGIT